jgi:alpha-glucosidase (family GH31 glycosyl hydrolase)
MKPILQDILHDPFGLHHPYEQEPFERTPRTPQQDQEISIGVVSYPVGAAERVWLEWSIDGEAGAPIQVVHAEKSNSDEERDHWKMVLPAFKNGQQVTYQVYAGQGECQVSCGPFSFTIPVWSHWRNVTAWRSYEKGIQLDISTSNPALHPQLRIEFDDPGQLRLWITSQSVLAGETLAISGSDAPFYRIIEDSPQSLVVESSGLRLVINRQPYSLSVYDQYGNLLLRGSGSPAFLTDSSNQVLELREEFFSTPAEGFYGFGERFNDFNQRGNRLDIRVYDQYKNQGLRTYIPVPFFLSSQGYGQYLHTNRYVIYDLDAGNTGAWSYQAELGVDGGLSYTLFTGQPAGILQAYTALTGKPKLPPAWVFGPWMSSNEWNRQSIVMEQVQKTLQLDIPATVLVIEAWSDENTFYIWNDAQYTPRQPAEAFSYADFDFPKDGRWPDPKAMVDELHRSGIKLVLWQIPVFRAMDAPHTQHTADIAYAIEQGYCVREADDSPYRVRSSWFNHSHLLDATNPAALDWWLNKRAYLLDEVGIDGFKTDGGEHIWGRDLQFSNGMRGDEVWNLYPNLYVGAYHEFVDRKRNGQGATFSRAGFTGAQAYPCHWAGDENSTWEAFRVSIRCGLNIGLSGVPFWGWDIAGFSGEIPSAELYLRSTAMAAFCPIMQYHSELSPELGTLRDRTPWNIAERTNTPEVVAIYRNHAHLRQKLLPYIQAEAAYCAETGEPMMRPLLLDWPDIPEIWDIADQYCFGRSLLVAPVVEPGVEERSLYLPPGEWQDLWDGTLLEGGRWIKRPAPISLIPVYLRKDRPSSELEQLIEDFYESKNV